jgi:4-amino-4-deoxy-L-arabinose transferase-like glycosyltransferase
MVSWYTYCMLSKKTKTSILLLVAILTLGFLLRFYKLSTLPPGLTWDEAGLGYNAYSILKTARDEHGTFLPLTFKSFGDYKPGLYVYLAVPFIALTGLTEVAVRLPSVIAGTLAIFGVYLLVNQLFDKKKALLAALVLSLSPWHIHFSRGAWEVNIFTTVLLFAIYFFIRSLKNSRYFIPWVLLAASTIFIYQGAKMLTPLIFLGLLVIYFPQVKKSFSSWLIPKSHKVVAIFSSLLLSFFFILNLTGPAGNRLARLSIFGYKPQLSGDKLFHNQPLLTSQLIASRYLYHFSPEVLFYQGSTITERGNLPKQGMLYITEAFFLLLGFAALAKLKNKQSRNLVLSLLFLSPIPASMTLAEFSTFRALFIVIPLSIISALGLHYFLTKYKKIITLPILFFVILNIVLTINIYFNHSFEGLAPEFNYGYKQAFDQINTLPEANNIIFTDVYGQPYIYYLFYNQFDPAAYQKINSYQGQGIDVGKVDRVGDKIEFHQFSHTEIFNHANTWFVGTRGNIPDEFNINDGRVEYYSEISIPNREPAFRLVKTSKL